MLRHFVSLCVFLVMTLCFSGQSHALIVNTQTDKVSVDVITSVNEISSHQPLEVLVKLKMHNGWHIYGDNPGDAGEPTNISWKLPTEYQIESLGQSIPEKYVVDGLVQYGYADTAYWKYQIIPVNSDIDVKGQQNFQAVVSWLACKDECVPEIVKIDFSLPVLTKTKPVLQVWQDENSKAEASFPAEITPEALYEVKGDRLLINVDTKDKNFVKDVRQILFIPDESDLIINNGEQTVGFDGMGNLSLSVPLEDSAFENINGLLVVEDYTGRRAYRLVPQRAERLVEHPVVHYNNDSLVLIMIMAFLGGIILNFMPCIFPILSIKAIALVQSTCHRKDARAEALIYMAGVVISFLLTATILVWLRHQGEQLGWGFQLQSPIFVLVMIIIFFIIFLMLLDVINFHNFFANRLGGVSFSARRLNAFFTGLFAVLVASPCAAPFMGIAIGYSLTKPVYIYYPVFLALGIGYALPFTLIGCFPDVVARILPKPGRWMNLLKKVFAIPVLLTCFWLMWVFAHLVTPTRISDNIIVWNVYDEQEIQNLRQDNQAVFIDFTAKWCLTCLVNDKMVLGTPHFAELVKKRQLHIFKADWTTKDPQIAAALELYGRNSIPLYVYYAPGENKYVILPQLLTPGIIDEYLE